MPVQIRWFCVPSQSVMRTISFFLISCIALGVSGQARNANWVFADGMWMAFTDSSMTMQPSPYSGPARSSCISDTSGQFLLLVDDTGIRNALFDLLPGGSAADLGWSNPAANYMILPKPGTGERYIILINEEPPSARAGHVEVDVAANGGTGAVLGGCTWYMDNVTAKLSATTDAAEEGYWIVQHVDSGNAFQAFHLTGQGLDPVPVTSSAGRSYLSDTPDHINADRWGQMKLSFQGDKLAAITNGADLDTNALELFHFDRGNGSLEFWTRIDKRIYGLDTLGQLVNFNMLSSFPFMSDLEFERNGTHLYIARSDTVNPNMYGVQVSLEDPDPVAIQRSAFGTMGFGPFHSSGYDFHGSLMLMGNNGLLYSRHVDYPQDQNHMFGWINLPTQMSYLSGPDQVYLLDLGWSFTPPYATNIGGFPNLCKRYLDSAPLGTGICEVAPATTLHVRPNPIIGQAVLEVTGPVQPDLVRWHDVLGHLVRETDVRQYGPSLLLDRTSLPAGIYMVEPMAHGKSLGFVRVVCE
jgi:hypothetical protein